MPLKSYAVIALSLVAVVMPYNSRVCAREIGFRTVALTGTDGPYGPNAGPGVTYSQLFRPSLNQPGDLAFLGFLEGGGIGTLNNTGIYLNRGGVNNPVALRGAQDTGLGDGVFLGQFLSNPPLLNDAGTVVFLVIVGGTGVTSDNSCVIFRNDGSGNIAIAREDTGGVLGPGPGSLELFQSLFNPSSLNTRGDIAFASRFRGSQDFGVFLNKSGVVGNANMALGATDGPFGPGLGSGVRFKIISSVPRINDAGTAVFEGFHTFATNALYLNHGSGNYAFAFPDSDDIRGPGIGAGAYFTGFNPNLRINDAGSVVFLAGLAGAGIDQQNNSGVFVGNESGNTLRAQEGATGVLGPGLGEGVEFAGFPSITSPEINDAGEIGFISFLRGGGFTETEDLGVFINRGTENSAVAVTGTDGPLGPQLGPGIEFIDFSIGSSIRLLTLNNRGDVMFMGNLVGSGIDASNDRGIWAYIDGLLMSVLLEGDLFDVDPDPTVSDQRLITNVSFVIGNGNSFNDKREIAFLLDFQDGSQGVFTASVPEPTGLAVLTTMGCLFLRPRI